MLKKVLLTLISVAFAGLFVYINMGDSVDPFAGMEIIPESHIVLTGVNMVRNLDTHGGYFSINAENAHYDHNIGTLNLTQLDVYVWNNRNDFVARSDYGIYVIEQSLEAWGNLFGVWNNATYEVADGGRLLFGFAEQQAILGDGVSISMGNSNIFATTMVYNVREQVANFTGDVEMLFSQEDFR